MKRILIFILISIVFAVGCSSTKNAGGGPGTSMQGTWTITGNLNPNASYQVVVVSSPCSVTTPVGTFSVQGPGLLLPLTITLGKAQSPEQEYPTPRKTLGKEF